ncbi:MAG TPA: flagellar basal body-associated FliL family protein [Armatimonadota bacterium]|nr:flagellar basal body-associated FliL family protein [Armatimonadota bacterium]
MKNILVIVIVVIVALAAGAGGAFVMAKGNKAKQQTEHVEKPKRTTTYKLEERTINLSDSNASHYLRLTLVLQLAGSGNVKEIEDNYSAGLMDAEINVASKYTYQMLLSSTGKQTLKKELKEGFNTQLKDSGWMVSDVLMTDFLME